MVIFCFYSLVVQLTSLVSKMAPSDKSAVYAFLINKKVDFDVYMLALPGLVKLKTEQKQASQLVVCVDCCKYFLDRLSMKMNGKRIQNTTVVGCFMSTIFHIGFFKKSDLINILRDSTGPHKVLRSVGFRKCRATTMTKRVLINVCLNAV